jgi:hypothetical protein
MVPSSVAIHPFVDMRRNLLARGGADEGYAGAPTSTRP